MKLTTSTTEQSAATTEQMTAALRLLRTGDADSFVVVERQDGVALQVLPLTLERCEGGRVYRASMPPAIVELFEAFVAGRSGWERGIEWTEVTKNVRAERRQVIWLLVLLLAFVIVLVAYLVLRGLKVLI